MLNVVDLFSGIGCFSLGLERTGGFRTVAFCENNDFARRVLTKHWPDVPLFGDVRQFGRAALEASGIALPDVVCGGFPCTDISVAGRGAGLEGENSRLWFDMLRIIAETRPSWVIVENVPLLRSRGLDTVLRGLDEIGYDAEWHCIPACAVGACHRRDRIWVIAYAVRSGCGELFQPVGQCRSLTAADTGSYGQIRYVPHFNGRRWEGRSGNFDQPYRRYELAHGNSAVPDPGSQGLPIPERGPILTARRWEEGRAVAERGWWSVEPEVGRVVHGPADRVDRRKRIIALGNSLVPQIPEIIGYAILDYIANCPTLGT